MSTAHQPPFVCEDRDGRGDRYDDPSTLIMPNGSLVCWHGTEFALGLAMWTEVLAAWSAAG